MDDQRGNKKPIVTPAVRDAMQQLESEKHIWKSEALIVWRKLRTMTRVLQALVLREIMTRFGRENLGFVWLILEPLILTTLVMVAWSIMYGTAKHGVTVVQIVLSGYSMVTLWRHMILRFGHCFRHNAGLLFHRNVRPLDTILARFFLETVGTLISFTISYITLFLLDLIDPIYDIYLMIIAWILLALFSFTVALIFSALGELWEHTEKFVQPMMYVTLPLTGMFFMLSWIPSDYHHILLMSPMIHTVEMFRAGLIGPSVETYYDPSFVVITTVFLGALALLLMRKAESHIRIE